jgi:hypothetical protein
MTTKRVSFIQSLLADPEKKKKLMVDSIIATQAREGIKTTREQAEAAYARAQSRPNSSRIESSPVAPKRVSTRDAGREGNGHGSVPAGQSGGTRHSKATAEGSGVARPDGQWPVVAESEGRLDHIQSVTGVLRAYDGRYCVWGANGPFDVRDIGNRIGLSMHDVVDALPDFTPVKRGRASVTPDEDSTE